MFEVFNRTVAPYNTVCYILCQWADGSYTRGSGVVVGVNDVLTAAHVVYNADRGGYAVGITVSPAADTFPSLVEPYGSFSDWGVVHVRTSNWDSDGDGLLTQAEAQYDLAVIGLRTAIGEVTGTSGLWAKSHDLYGTMVGYPSESYGGTGMMAASVWADASSTYGVFAIDDRLGPGSSGGPLFYTEGGHNYVVGIASAGDNDSSTYAGLFGPGNWSWLQDTMQDNDSVLPGGGGGGGGGGSTDDYAESTATSGRISVGGTATGQVEVYTDEDWFRIELSTAGTYRFEVLAQSSNGGTLEDPVLNLYDGSGTLIGFDDDSGPGTDPDLSANLAAGTYYLGVGSYLDATSQPGTYTLRASGSGQFNGTSGADSLTGTSANETFQGNGGNDTMNGMGGTDTVYYAGERGEYLLGRSSGAITVFDSLGLDGTDRLTNMERIVFADMTVNLQIGATSQTISAGNLKLLQELYVAFFNRVPDADGLGYWIDQFRGGMSIDSIANAFYNAALAFPSETGYSSSMSNADFVNIVYRNVLGREDGADPDGLAHWTGLLASGAATRGSLVTTILGSAHSFKGHSTWGWVADLLDNKAAVAQVFAVEMGLNYNTASASITHGIEIAGAVTPFGIESAVSLIGIADGFSTLG